MRLDGGGVVSLDSANLYSAIFFACTLAVGVFAVWCGGRPERLGAGLVFLGWLSSVMLDVAFGTAEPTSLFLAIDFLMLVGFAVIFFRYDRLWAGVAACFAALLLAFEGSRLLNFPLSYGAYVTALNISSYGALAALAFGTWAHRRRPAG